MESAIIRNTIPPFSTEQKEINCSANCSLASIRASPSAFAYMLRSSGLSQEFTDRAVRIGNKKKNSRKITAIVQRRCFVFSLIILKNKLLDVIACHLRFTDKYLLQRQREHLKKDRMIRLQN